MSDFKALGVDVFDPIGDKMQEIIDCFVEFYGEKYRNRITEKLHNAVYVFAPKLYNKTSLTEAVEKFTTNGGKVYISRLLGQCGILDASEYSYDDIKKMVSITSVENMNEKLSPELYSKLMRSFNLANDSLNSDLTEDVGSIELYENRKQINELYEKILNIKIHYTEKYQKLFTKLNEIKVQIKEADRVLTNERNKCDEKLNEFLTNELYSIRKQNNVESENDMSKYAVVLKNLYRMGQQKFVESTQIKYISDYYVKFFKLLGYKLGDKIDDYKNDQNLMKTIFNPEKIKQFENQSKKYLTDVVLYSPIYNQAIKTIEALKIEDRYKKDFMKSLLHNFIFVKNNTAAFVKIHNEDPEGKVCCYCEDLFHASDEELIHEMNHLIEIDQLIASDGKRSIKSGFRYSAKQQIYGDDVKMLNEVVNDYLSLKVVQKLHQKRARILLGKARKSVYSYAFPLLKDFIEDNFESLAEIRLSEKPEQFEKKYGEDFMLKLAKLANDFVKFLSQNEVEESVEKELTAKYGEVKDISKEYNNMMSDKFDWSDTMKKYLSFFSDRDELLSSLKKQTKPHYVQDTLL